MILKQRLASSVEKIMQPRPKFIEQVLILLGIVRHRKNPDEQEHEQEPDENHLPKWKQAEIRERGNGAKVQRARRIARFKTWMTSRPSSTLLRMCNAWK